jgi:hypothetical protein
LSHGVGDIMEEFGANFYRCPKCTRVTSNYPFGCRNKPCPVKKDMLWDMTYGTFVTFVMVFIFFVFFVIILTRYGGHPAPAVSLPNHPVVRKNLDFYPEPRYTK